MSQHIGLEHLKVTFFLPKCCFVELNVGIFCSYLGNREIRSHSTLFLRVGARGGDTRVTTTWNLYETKHIQQLSLNRYPALLWYWYQIIYIDINKPNLMQRCSQPRLCLAQLLPLSIQPANTAEMLRCSQYCLDLYFSIFCLFLAHFQTQENKWKQNGNYFEIRRCRKYIFTPFCSRSEKSISLLVLAGNAPFGS